jgi:hypothetical protein
LRPRIFRSARSLPCQTSCAPRSRSPKVKAHPTYLGKQWIRSSGHPYCRVARAAVWRCDTARTSGCVDDKLNEWQRERTSKNRPGCSRCTPSPCRDVGTVLPSLRCSISTSKAAAVGATPKPPPKGSRCHVCPRTLCEAFVSRLWRVRFGDARNGAFCKNEHCSCARSLRIQDPASLPIPRTPTGSPYEAAAPLRASRSTCSFVSSNDVLRTTPP